MITGLLGLIIVLAIVGVILWFITTYIPMPAVFKGLIVAIAAIVVLLYLLQFVNSGKFGHL